MESLLLGTLSYYGNTMENTNIKNNNKNMYDSNINDKMNMIEKNQANTLKNSPEFFQQFDSLSFDNLSIPTPENVAYTTRSGFNINLQRDIDFNNGYSEFQNTDMHYGVTPKEQFVHNNMIPFTRRRETFINLDSNTRKYEQLSGNNEFWKNKKEVEPFFDPVKDMNNVYGLPVMTEQLSQRYNPSLKNNYGNVPFQTDVRVVPGLDGKISAPYAVHRIMPRNIDELRSEINKKESYRIDPIETIKKGDMRAIESQITNFKIPSYREVSFNDLVPNKFYVEGERQTGDFVHTDTERGLTDYEYVGGAYNSNKGTCQGKDSIDFTPAKRENYENDFTHAINAVNTRPVFTNIDSYTNYVTDRSEISQELHATGAYNNNMASYYYDSNDMARPTMKQNNIIQNNYLGINGPLEQKSYVFSNDSILPVTNRESTNYNDVGNTSSTYQSGPLTYTDNARQTVKETTINNYEITNIVPTKQNKHVTLSDIAKKTIRETTNYNNVSNVSATFQNTNLMPTDNAKQTIKQTTVENSFILNPKPIYEKGNLMLQDEAKVTIKETTIYNKDIANVTSSFQNTHITLNDIAKRTIRETTENNDYISNLAANYKKNNLLLSDKAKTTIKETTIDNDFIGQAVSNVNLGAAYLTDQAKPTIKHTTLYSYNGNANYQQGSIYAQNNDEAKPTIRETTENNNYIGITTTFVKDSYNSLTDEARQTIKETTLNTTLQGQNIIANVPNSYTTNDEEARPTIKETLLHEANGSLYDPNKGYYNINDEAKITIKQTTLLTNYKGNATTNVNALRVEDAERNMTIDDKRQQTALCGRLAGAKSDQIRGDINKETVRFNDKRYTNSYVSNPGMSKNYSVTPNCKKTIVRKTDLNTNTFYYVDPIQTCTLKDNPLVNDIYHQKNIDFYTGL